MEYLSLFNLNSSIDFDDYSIKSRRLVSALKGGKTQVISQIPPFINSKLPSNVIEEFLSKERVLVPVPRSTPIKTDALFPSLEICKVFHQSGWGHSINQLVKRNTTIRTSHLQTGADNRPSVEEHVNTLIVESIIPETGKITLIDDVITLGRTGMACYNKLKDVFPNLDIKFVSVLKTRNITPQTFYSSTKGSIEYYSSGKTFATETTEFPTK